MNAVRDHERRVEELCALIEEYNRAYYLKDRPLVSDAEYDKLFRELQELEEAHPHLRKPDSPTQRVGTKPLDKFKKYLHRQPMMSLANAMNPEELEGFHERVLRMLDNGESEIEYHAELKFDGLSINLVYEKGILTHAATRGDGIEGEEVTENVRTIGNVPLRLHTKTPPDFVEIRGEIVLPYAAFQELNEQQIEEGQEPFANPRNAAAGSVRQLDSRLTAERDLRLYPYSIGAIENHLTFERQDEVLKCLVDWGFQDSPRRRVCRTFKEVHDFYDEVQRDRETFAFDIDGVVVKVNSLYLQKKLGNIARSPRAMIAAKFPPRQQETVLEGIAIQVGRTGVLSPVAILKPVIVHGVKVSRATLHNQEEIERKDVRIGDHVVVQRAGDVIPEVVGPIVERRTGEETKFIFPSVCPSCSTPVARLEGEIAIRCVNEACPAQLEGRLEHFVSKAGLDIAGLGPKILEQLTKKGFVKSYSDIYRLTMENALKLEGFKEKSASKLIVSIEESKRRSLSSLIAALGIRHVGSQLARTLAREFRTLDELIGVQAEHLARIDAIGPVVAAAVSEYFSKPENIAELRALQSLGLNPKFNEAPTKLLLQGKTFVVTGTLARHDRSEIERLIEANGGRAAGSVSKKTSYIIAGEAAGSKLSKAKELGIPILSEDDFLAMITK